mgnify:CR=1 FL=1
MEKLLNKFMVKTLGYKNYFVQGGDWGATIAGWIGLDSSKYCKGIHLNCLPLRHPKGPKNTKEKKWEKKFNYDQITQEGYRTQQATKPQSWFKGSCDRGDVEGDRIDFTVGSQRQGCSAAQGRSLEMGYTQGACKALLLEFAVLPIRL